MKQTHTPGPWRKVGGRTSADWNIETMDEFPRLVATVRESGRSEFREREVANATLIAAAPLMVEALREARRFIHCQDVHSCYHPGGLCDACKTRDAIFAALKAAGVE